MNTSMHRAIAGVLAIWLVASACNFLTGASRVPTEVVEGLTQFAFDLGARRIDIEADCRNERSWRVAERAGYSLDAILHNYSRDVDGALSDVRIYSRVGMDPPSA